MNYFKDFLVKFKQDIALLTSEELDKLYWEIYIEIRNRDMLNSSQKIIRDDIVNIIENMNKESKL